MGEPKTKASKAPVPLHSLLAESMQSWQRESPYSQPTDWVFPSRKLKGRKPRCANMLVEDYLRPAAEKAGVLVKDDPRRFGYHNLRHSLASFLVRSKTDVKTAVRVQLQRRLHVRVTKQILYGECSLRSCSPRRAQSTESWVDAGWRGTR
jgi:integrase